MFWNSRTYLDVAAACPVTPSAKRAFMRGMRLYGNPGGMHQEAREGRTLLEESRAVIAKLTGVKSEFVTFTSGATEANTLAIEGVVGAFLKKGRALESLHLLYHPGAHASVVQVMERLQTKGVRAETIALKDGAPDLLKLQEQITKDTVLISLEAVSPETGRRIDTRSVAQLLSSLETSTLLHVDASQLPLVESVDRTRLGAHLLTLDAQKIGGVRGIGALGRGSGIPLVGVTLGGGQERGLRPGTEAPALAYSFAAALLDAGKGREKFVTASNKARTLLIQQICKEFPDAVVHGGKMSAPHILCLSFPGRDTDYLVTLLDQEGFAVSTRSSCEADSEAVARMVFAETNDQVLASSTLRISWSPMTNLNALKCFAKTLTRTVRFLDQNAS
jgi:cysteine desulfurase